MNLFYNPLVTYIPLLIKQITPSYAIALKVFAGICIVLSGITMYKFVYHVTNKRVIALFAAILYLTIPYKLGDVYKRFAIGEFAAFVFLPILFIGMYNLFNEDAKKHYLITIGAAGLLLTHTVTTFYTAIICLIYVLFNIKKLKEKQVIKYIIINVIFIVLICLFFIAPMFEAKFATEYAIFDSKIMVTNGNYVYDHTLELSDFFTDIVSDTDVNVCSIGIPSFILLFLSIFTYKKVEEKYKNFYYISILFAVMSVYMSSKYCPWMIFPDFFCKLQYPWRMLTFFAFFVPFVASINIYILTKEFIKNNNIRFILYACLIVIIVVYTMPIILQYETTNTTIDKSHEKTVTENPYISYFSINREYLPVKAIYEQRKYLLNEKDFDKSSVLEGKAIIKNEEKIDLKSTMEIEDVEEGTIIEFTFFYYPGYEVTLQEDGKEITNLECIESRYGLACVKLDKDISNARLTIQYKGTTITYVTYTISLISFIGFIVYIVYFERKNKN